MKRILQITLIITLFFQNLNLFGETGQKKNTDFLSFVTAYADAILDHGRDIYGEEHSPLFASALNRESLKLGQVEDFGEIQGVRVRDRSLFGANLIHDISLFKILYALTELTGDNKYADEADKALKYFFNHCQSQNTGLMCWGEHLYWDFISDDCGYSPDYDFHEAKVWPFWNRSYKLAPEACFNFILGEWDHQINDKNTGDFSRHGRYSKHQTFSGFDFPRYAGQMIERWADAYSRPENANRPRKEELLHYIEVVFNRMQQNQKLSQSGLLVAGRAKQGDHINVVWLTSNLELARCLEAAAPIMQPAISDKMREFALKQDQDFLNAPHKLDSAGGGFAVTLHAKTGLPRTRSMNKPYTSTWSSGYGYGTHAGVANIIYGRYESLKNNYAGMAEKYKDLIIIVGEKYLISEPDFEALLKPNEFSEVIELMRNCYGLTRNEKFLKRAGYFAQSGIGIFLNDDSPLPKATNLNDHYESITGGPSFMYELLHLHRVNQN